MLSAYSLPLHNPSIQVWQYPRPPALQPVSRRLRVIWRSPSSEETVIADTTKGYRVLETSHPPTYYIPPSDVKMNFIRPSAARRTMCEWKGQAQYHDLVSPDSSHTVKARIWSYPSPTPGFQPIKDYLCFYAGSGSNAKSQGSWKCVGAVFAFSNAPSSSD